MAVAKYIYLPVAQDTKEGDSNGNHKKVYKKISCLLLLFYVIYLLVHFFWKGMTEKCQEGKKSTIQNFTFIKTLALSFRASSVL